MISFALGSTITTLLLSNYPNDRYSFLSQRFETDLGVFRDTRFQKSCTEGNKQLRSIQHHLQRYRDRDSESFVKVQKGILMHVVNDQCTETVTLSTLPCRFSMRKGHIICTKTSNSNMTENTYASFRILVCVHRMACRRPVTGTM